MGSGKAKAKRPNLDPNVDVQCRAWAETARQINHRLVDLRLQSQHFRELSRVADDVAGFKGYYVMDIPRWFAAFAAMAIRREMDPSPDCRSLRQLLEEIARYGKPVPDYTGRPVDLKELRGFKKRLNVLSKKITHIADKDVAHATVSGADATLRPMFQELFDCVDEFESAAVRYHAYLDFPTLIYRICVRGVLPGI